MTSPEDFLKYDGPLPLRLGGAEWEMELQGIDGRTHIPNFYTEAALEAAGYRHITSYKQGGAWMGSPQESWLETGDRLYIDRDFWELSRRERRGIRHMAADDMAGPLIMSDIIAGSGHPFQGLHRRVGSGFGAMETLGYHPNLIVPTWVVEQHPGTAGRFLASSQSSRTWAWNGTFSEDGYWRSQKAQGLGIAFAFRKQNALRNGQKPMLVLHKGGNVDRCNVFAPEWSRYEDRSACAPLTGMVSMANFGANALGLRALEHLRLVEHLMPGLQFKDPVRAIQTFSQDLSLRATAETLEGTQLTAADHQQAIASMFRLLDVELELPAEEREIVGLTGQAADGMKSDEENGDIGSLAWLCASDMKLRFVRKKAGNAAIRASKSVNAMDVHFDSVDPEGSGLQIFSKPRLAAISERYVPQALIEAGRRELPNDTRAYRRGEFVRSDPGPQKVMHWSRSLGERESYEDKNAGQRWYDPFDAGLGQVP